MRGAPTLSVRGLRTHFFTRLGVLKAVDDVDLSVGEGEILGLVGESGSGKTVTGFSITGLVDEPGRIVGGSVFYRGEDLRAASEERLQKLRGHRISMIFQDPMMTLNPVLRIDTQIIEAVRVHDRSVDRSTARQRATDALRQVGISAPERRLSCYPHQLSGGMRQRVAIAIAFINNPDLVIADEPTTALDVTIQAQILFEATRLCRDRGTAMIWITHDLAVVAGFADRIAVMYAGRIVETGKTSDVISNPQHPYTIGLLGSVPTENRRGRRLQQIPGMTPNLMQVPASCAFMPRCFKSDPFCECAPETTEPFPGRRVRCHFPAGETNVQGAAP